MTDFIQFEPSRGNPSSNRTESLVLYDDTHVYVAFRVWDAEPLTAQLTRRDSNLWSDDSVIVLIDTFHDRQTGYGFMTNPLGTQTDGRISDDGRASDTNWDADWTSAVQRTDYGWSAEFAIPLKSIQYSAGQAQTWGMNLGRSRRRTLEVSFWSGPVDDRFRVSQAGQLTGLDLKTATERQAKALEEGVPTARVVRVRGAHYIFLSKRVGDVTRDACFSCRVKVAMRCSQDNGSNFRCSALISRARSRSADSFGFPNSVARSALGTSYRRKGSGV